MKSAKPSADYAKTMHKHYDILHRSGTLMSIVDTIERIKTGQSSKSIKTGTV